MVAGIERDRGEDDGDQHHLEAGGHRAGRGETGGAGQRRAEQHQERQVGGKIEAGDDLADVGSVYLADCRVQDDTAPYAVDAARALRLWEISEKLCNAGIHG